MSGIYNNYFTGTFGIKELASSFLETYLAEEIIKTIDLDSLEQQNETHIDAKNIETRSDIIYKGKINGIESYIYLLFEHKSSPDKHTARQLLGYMNSIWEKATANTDQATKDLDLLPILPIVVYHGQQEWKVPKKLTGILKGYQQMPEIQKQKILDFEYIMIDLVREIKDRIEDPALDVVITTLKNSHQDDETSTEILIQITKTIGAIPEAEAQPHLATILIRTFYFFIRNKNIDTEKYYKEIEGAISKERREQLMTTAEKLIQQGMEQGIEQGKKEAAKNALLLGLDLQTTASIVNIPLEELIAIKNEVENRAE